MIDISMLQLQVQVVIFDHDRYFIAWQLLIVNVLMLGVLEKNLADQMIVDFGTLQTPKHLFTFLLVIRSLIFLREIQSTLLRNRSALVIVASGA